MYSVLLKRFIRGGIAGATSVMLVSLGTLATNQISSLSELQVWASVLVFSGIAGFISGLLAAVDKWARFVPETDM